MSLTETKEIDKIEVVQLGIIQVREATTIFKDGQFYARTYHRWSFTPGSDVSEMPANVQAVANAAWTPEVRQAYETFKTEQAQRLNNV